MINNNEPVRKGPVRRSIQLILLLLILGCAQAYAAESLVVPMTIEGTVYNAKLQENKALLRKLGSSFNSVNAHHYKGVIEGVADSWIRVSNIDGQWQGIASVNGVLEVIDNQAPTTTPQGVKTTGPAPLNTTPASHFNDKMKKCGVSVAQSPASTSSTATSSSSSLTTINAAQPVADAVSFSSFCANKVDGVCMIAELELIFDQDFQTLITTKTSSSADAQAASLINIVEGYYLNDLNMGFDAITVKMLTSPFFTTSTDSSTVLKDIFTKKSSGGIPFLKNTHALTHLITGRNFDGSVVGVAYVSSVCQSNYSVGTSSVIVTGSNNIPSIPLTSLVVAHELGHNFGASHDGDGNTCPSTGYIMGPVLDPNATHFSSCSVTAMQNQIDTATSKYGATACFNFPADAGITADSGNQVSVNRNDPFALLYTVSLVNGYHAAAQLQIKGSINATGGELGSVTANGNACSVSGGTTYTCTVNSPGASLALSVGGTANGSGNQLQLTNNVSVQDSQVLDLNAANDQLTDTISIVDAPVTPPGITVTPSTGLITSESGATASFTIVLDSQPANSVTVNLRSSDTTEGTVSPSSISFTTTNWNTSQKVTVTGVDDNLFDGDIKYNVSFTVQSTDSKYNGLTVVPVNLTNKDNEPLASFTVTPTAGLITSEAGGSASFSVVLDRAPASTVNITLTSSDTTEGTVSPSSISFTTANWNTSQTITVTGVDDNLVDGDINYNVSFTVQSADTNYNGFTIAPVSLTNQDNDSQVSPSNGGGSNSGTNTSSNTSTKGGAVSWWWIMCCGLFTALRRRNSLRTLTI